MDIDFDAEVKNDMARDELERLRAIEAAARELVDSACTHRDIRNGLSALRAALGNQCSG